MAKAWIVTVVLLTLVPATHAGEAVRKAASADAEDGPSLAEKSQSLAELQAQLHKHQEELRAEKLKNQKSKKAMQAVMKVMQGVSVEELKSMRKALKAMEVLKAAAAFHEDAEDIDALREAYTPSDSETGVPVPEPAVMAEMQKQAVSGTPKHPDLTSFAENHQVKTSKETAGKKKKKSNLADGRAGRLSGAGGVDDDEDIDEFLEAHGFDFD